MKLLKTKKRKRRNRKKAKVAYKYKVLGYFLMVGLMTAGLSTRYVMFKSNVEKNADDPIKIFVP